MALSMNTDFTRLLGLRTPIVSAPMAGASGGNLAAQVSLGGGFGFIAAGYDTPHKFGHELALARAALQIPAATRLPLGVGFLCWQLEKPDSPASKLLSIALENGVQAVWFSFGTQLGRWVQYVRDYDQRVGSTQRTLVFAQVSSEQDILAAVNDWKVDVLVVQGNESGGHGFSNAAPTASLVLKALPLARAAGIPLLAAGGLATGAHVASMLALGASGAVLGTRFLLTPESLYTDKQRQALLDASDSSTVRTMAFDVARGTLGWPEGVDGRALRNSTVVDHENGRNERELKELFAKAQVEGDRERMLVWAGTGVGAMNSIKPAKEVVEELHNECVEHLQMGPRL
ncbi:hypothetical protein PLEOSDRAFT_1066212 [Pleurotus ostreatus PC15]|uniref:Uncharacterized protein n=1 Tax=Pleurotus ostreatus (strain PC15) TaxID=1137138 RepID=A0A067NTJ0_PLEO1|nr:hypothetical protein PLEOSDRAFT_1066212 [Pleurotus ostreatus PC15]